MKSISLSQAIAGYLINLSARHLSPNTIKDYTNTLTKLTKYLGNTIPVSDIGIDQVNAFLADFTTISNKTLSNYHTTLSSFFEWMVVNKLVKGNPVKFVIRAKPERRVIDPVPETELKALLENVKVSREYARFGKKICRNKLPTGDRNFALTLFILDNGVRATELCDLQLKDLDLKQLRAFIMGKGSKERYVPFSPRTSQAIWRYHANRNDLYPDDYVFATDLGRQMTRGYIFKMLLGASDRAGISHVHPHRLRHTFAINYLRAGGDIFTLQMILGHESLDMVRHYSRLAQSDVKIAHRRASPVEYLRL